MLKSRGLLLLLCGLCLMTWGCGTGMGAKQTAEVPGTDRKIAYQVPAHFEPNEHRSDKWDSAERREAIYGVKAFQSVRGVWLDTLRKARDKTNAGQAKGALEVLGTLRDRNAPHLPEGELRTELSEQLKKAENLLENRKLTQGATAIDNLTKLVQEKMKFKLHEYYEPQILRTDLVKTDVLELEDRQGCVIYAGRNKARLLVESGDDILEVSMGYGAPSHETGLTDSARAIAKSVTP